MDRPPFVIFGCGFTGTEVAKLALAAGSQVTGTTQSSERSAALAALGIAAHAIPLTDEAVRALVPEGARVLVSLPPDGHTDVHLASGLGRASRIVYISTTGVFGEARGHVDETTPVDPREPSAARRLMAEHLYRDHGGAVLRPAGIYGPFRGLHQRLKSGSFRIPGAGTNVVSRIHVADLAAIAFAMLAVEDSFPRGEVFVVADDAPVPQLEVIAWLCRRLHLPLPAHAPLEEVSVTLRHDRAVDNTKVKRALSLALRFPSYREGFEACLTVEGLSPNGAAVPP